jgi:hypothetical protein
MVLFSPEMVEEFSMIPREIPFTDSAGIFIFAAQNSDPI